MRSEHKNVHRGYYSKCATQFHHPIKKLGVVLIIPVYTYIFFALIN